MYDSGGLFSLYVAGLSSVFQYDVLLALLAGTTLGVVFGAIPGLSAVVGVAVITPLTFGMNTTMAFAILLGVYCGGVYGGSISAILLNIPGTACAVMTRLDGHPMALNGQAGRAIGLATISSFLGGVLSVIVLALFAPALANMALELSAQEYFSVCIFGLSVIVYISHGMMLKGFISAILGLLLATVGTDPIDAYTRFAFGNTQLIGGLEMIPIMVGIFGVGEVLKMGEQKDIGFEPITKIGKVLTAFKDLWKHKWSMIRGSLMGVFIGAIPASGGTIAAILSYGIEKRLAKNPEDLGKGDPRGIIGPESANNAGTGGAMIPMLTLGIPGDIVTAILIGALMLHGLAPGPMLFKNNPEVVSSIFILMLLANFMFLVIGLSAAKYFAKIITWPRSILLSLILILTIAGTYGVRNSIFDIWVLFLAGIAGFAMDKVGIPAAPFVLAFVLGKLVEQYLRRALVLSFGNFWDFFSRPISAFFLVITFLMIAGPYLFTLAKKMVAFALKKGGSLDNHR